MIVLFGWCGQKQLLREKRLVEHTKGPINVVATSEITTASSPFIPVLIAWVVAEVFYLMPLKKTLCISTGTGAVEVKTESKVTAEFSQKLIFSSCYSILLCISWESLSFCIDISLKWQWKATQSDSCVFNPTMPATGPARGYTRMWFVPGDVTSFLLHAVWVTGIKCII